MSNKSIESTDSAEGNGPFHVGETPQLTELQDALVAALERIRERGESETPSDIDRTVDASTESDATDVGELLERAVRALGDYLGADSGEPAKDLLDEVRDVSREITELLAHVDPDGVAEAVTLENVPEVVEFDDLPKAVADRDYREAIAYENVPELVDWHRLADAVNTREFLRNKRELDRELDDVTDYAPDATRSDGDDADTAGPPLDPAAAAVSAGALKPDEFKRTAVQKQFGESVETVRENLLDLHARLRERAETAQEETNQVGQPKSRNPTAVSTLPRSRPERGSATRHSTVPAETLHSAAPNHDRIYGRRFDGELERTNR